MGNSAHPPDILTDRQVQGLVLDLVSDGTVLMGSLASLANGLGTTVVALRSSLRELLESGQIAIATEPRGRLTIRRERRRRRQRPPAVERRRPRSDDWLL